MYLVPRKRLELLRCRQRRILNPLRLPIPPSRHGGDFRDFFSLVNYAFSRISPTVTANRRNSLPFNSLRGYDCFLRRLAGRLQRRQRDGEHNVFNQRTARQVVHRLGQTLQHGAYAQAIRVALNGLVRCVAMFKSGKMYTVA